MKKENEKAKPDEAMPSPLDAIVGWFRGHDLGLFKIRIDYKAGDFSYTFPQFRVRVFFAWYDFWIGVYVDRKGRQIYIFPVPMIGIQIGYQW